MVKRTRDNLPDLTGLDDTDEAIRATLSSGRGRSAARMTPAQREKARRDAERIKLTIDISAELKDWLIQTAAELEIPYSSLVVYLLSRARESVQLEEIIAARVISRSMRYAYKIPFQEPEQKKRKTPF